MGFFIYSKEGCEGPKAKSNISSKSKPHSEKDLYDQLNTTNDLPILFALISTVNDLTEKMVEVIAENKKLRS